MFLVEHLKSEFDTTDLPSKRSVLSSVIYITRFSGKILLRSAKDVSQLPVEYRLLCPPLFGYISVYRRSLYETVFSKINKIICEMF